MRTYHQRATYEYDTHRPKREPNIDSNTTVGLIVRLRECGYCPQVVCSEFMNRTFWVNVIEIIILTFNCIIFGARIAISPTALHYAISFDSIGIEFRSQLITLPDSANIFLYFDLDTFKKRGVRGDTHHLTIKSCIRSWIPTSYFYWILNHSIKIMHIHSCMAMFGWRLRVFCIYSIKSKCKMKTNLFLNWWAEVRQFICWHLLLLLELNCWTPQLTGHHWMVCIVRDAHFIRMSHVKRKCVIYFIWIECNTKECAIDSIHYTHCKQFENYVFILSHHNE